MVIKVEKTVTEKISVKVEGKKAFVISESFQNEEEIKALSKALQAAVEVLNLNSRHD